MTNATIFPLIIASWSLFGLGSGADDKQDTIGELENQEVVIPEAKETQASREEALELYRKYLEDPDTDPAMRKEAQRRMGDLNVQAAEDAQFQNAGTETEAVFNNEAILAYEALLEQESGYAEADLVLYQLSRAYQSVGAMDQSLGALDRLVAEYPDSRYIDEAQFRRGEILFVRRNYFEAGNAFQQVVDFGESSAYYEQSLYMLGWSQFKQADYDPTISNFLDLLNRRLAAAEPRKLEIPQADPANFSAESLATSMTTEAIELQARFNSMSRPERELVDDTLRALSLTFSYLEGPDTISAVLDERANENDPGYLLYTHLGDLYLSKERYMDAAETYEAFVAREPNHFSAPDLSMRAVAAYKAGRFPSKVLEGKRAFVMAYGLDSEYWNHHNPAEREDVIVPLKANLTDLAQYDHAEAQRTGDPAAYARAAEWYRRYLEYFPKDPDSAQRSFLLGEVLMELGQFEEASVYYQRAAYNYPGYENAGVAGYAGILASRAHYETLQQNVSVAKAAELEATTPEAVAASQAATAEAEQLAAAWLQQQLHQAARFAWSFPEHEQANPVLSNTAEEYYSSGHPLTAIIVAGELLTQEPEADAELRRVTWTVTGHAHFELNHFARAEHAYLALRDMGDAGRSADPEAMAGLTDIEIDERIAAAIYRQAEVARAAEDIDAAVMHFLRVEKVTPNASIAAQSTFDGAVLLFNNERYLESIDVMLGFRETYPGHEYSNEITRNLAVAYQRTEQPLKAAVEYEGIVAFSLTEAELETRREAMWTAAELYQEGGDIANARRVWGQYVGEFPKPVSESIELRQVLADLAREAGDDADRVKWLRSIIAADASAGEERSLRTKTLAGKATLELAEPKRLAFNDVQLKIPLDKSMQRKKTLMESALTMYNDAAGYGIAEVTTEATYRIGELYQQLSADLMNSERPGGLSDDEEEMYEILLEEQAFPFDEKAIEVYQANTGRVLTGVWDEWVVRSYEQLAILVPARYAKYEKADEHVADMY